MADASATRLPLCVDLDGTVLLTDTLVEACLALVKRNPLWVLVLPFWLLRGKAQLKAQVAARVTLDASTLPYNTDLLAWLREAKQAGRRLLLVTAANRAWADAVAGHLGLFDEVLASDDRHNLDRGRKRDRLDELFGRSGYTYVANARADLAVWRHAASAVVVNASESLRRRAARLTKVEQVFPPSRQPARELLRAMRPHQWSKNSLLFVNLLMAHRLLDLPLLGATMLGFIAFCLCASAVYLLNDLLDLDADRAHATKCRRPFAGGTAPVTWGLLLIPVLLAAAIALAASVGTAFLLVLAVYFALTLAYSLALKRLLMLDVILLAMLYTLRIVAGAAAVPVLPSFWLLTFSIFTFTSLAMVKRFTELKDLADTLETNAGGRGYTVHDLPVISQVGTGCGLIATLVLALYINSDAVTTLYRQVEFLWLLCPLLIYWIGRIWLLASRGQLHQDPVIFATRDRTSYAVFALVLLVLWMAA